MTKFTKQLLGWYRRHRRDLPWRGNPDPYAVWISEIMLQQTRVEAVIPYFLRWMERFPTLEALAGASLQAVLSAWEGLGYYSRARNLHRAARIVQRELGGELPSDVEGLRQLPGIGDYTASAIASIAFGKDVATLDGNLRRVLSRVFDVRVAADTAAGEKNLWSLAQANLPPGRAGDYNQALMDLGATVCLPRNPACPNCPVADVCEAQKLGIQDQRPMRKPKGATPMRVHAAAVIVRRGRVLLARRPAKGLLGGMWEFPSGQVDRDPARELEDVVREGYGLAVQVGDRLGEFLHAYTHFRLTEHAFWCTLVGESRNGRLRWVPLGRLDDHPMGKVDRQIASQLAGK